MPLYLGNKRVAVTPNFIAMALFFVVLWIAGGASRGDAWGQVFVRATAWICVAGIVLFGTEPRSWRGRPVLYFLIAAVALVLAQLIPVPRSVWMQLPGRAPFAPILDVGPAGTWRPIAIVPSSAINAACALVVPIAAYLLMSGSRRSDDGRLIAMLLGLVFAMTVLGLVQLAGFSVNNPFVNGDGLVAAGMFANRNHFALFLALGCVLAPVWAFYERRHISWRAFVALAMAPLFLLTILASGSRAGILVGMIAFVGGLAVVWGNIRAALRRYPRWTLPGLIFGFFIVTAFLILFSVGQDRASSISRFMALHVDDEMRKRALPTVLEMIRTYFPLGSGFGGFDTLFRMHEPDALLKPSYFNRVHDDFLEVVLDGGLPAAMMLCTAVAWWLWVSIRAWRSSGSVLPKLGSLIVFLIAVASAFDYPARTPIITVLLAVAGVWLSEAGSAEQQCAPLRHGR